MFKKTIKKIGEKLRQIEVQAEDFLCKAYGVSNISDIEPPIKLEKVLDFIEIKLVPVDFEEKSIASIYDHELKTIYIKRKMQYPMIAFSAAYELGRHFFYKQDDVLFKLEFSDRDATLFASSLLIPKKLIQKQLKWTKDLEYLSRLFCVSLSTMQYRLNLLEST